MELLDEEQSKKQVKNHSTLILVLSILTIIGSVIQGVYVWFQINAVSLVLSLNNDWPSNIGGNPNDQIISGFSNMVEVYKFRLIGDYIWAGTIILSIIAAILFLSKRKSGIVFYSISSVVFILSSIVFFLVLGDLSKAFGGDFNPLMNVIEIISIICSLVFLFLYSMNYKKHSK